ncbi:MAG: hypothetical protein DRN12_08315, partial [Thermoplasmata archaeon]
MNNNEEKKKSLDFSIDNKKFEEIEKMIDAAVGSVKEDVPINLSMDSTENTSNETDLHEEKLGSHKKIADETTALDVKKPRRITHPKIPFKFPKVRFRSKKGLKENIHGAKTEKLD